MSLILCGVGVVCVAIGSAIFNWATMRREAEMEERLRRIEELLAL